MYHNYFILLLQNELLYNKNFLFPKVRKNKTVVTQTIFCPR